jgi:hypothetical protein
MPGQASRATTPVEATSPSAFDPARPIDWGRKEADHGAVDLYKTLSAGLAEPSLSGRLRSLVVSGAPRLGKTDRIAGCTSKTILQLELPREASRSEQGHQARLARNASLKSQIDIPVDRILIEASLRYEWKGSARDLLIWVRLVLSLEWPKLEMRKPTSSSGLREQ